ncbi:MAG: hypothetical protein KF845_06195 [Cyclobacteriaceae bacterium]|nr:hypothetical protein [Cyclobacteriaceae bacterium]
MKPAKKLTNIRLAITELFMITLGVSIALFFQFWYEEAKEHELEEKILKELLTTLNDDINRLENTIKSDMEILKAIDSVLTLTTKDAPYHPSIDTVIASAFQASPFHANVSGYETLKNLGLNLIRNDTLRISITNLYERIYSIKKYMFTYADDFWIEASASFIIQNFEQYSFITMKPNDFETLKKSKEFKALLQTNSSFRLTDQVHSKRALQDARKVAASIEAYLDTL